MEDVFLVRYIKNKETENLTVVRFY